MRLDFGHVMSLGTVALLLLYVAVSHLGDRGVLARRFGWSDAEDERRAEEFGNAASVSIMLAALSVVAWEAGRALQALIGRYL